MTTFPPKSPCPTCGSDLTLFAAPPVQMEAEPIGHQWLHTSPFGGGGKFWHHEQYYNGHRSEVSRAIYASPVPSSSERDDIIEMCAVKCDEHAVWFERHGSVLSAQEASKAIAKSLRSLKSQPAQEAE